MELLQNIAKTLPLFRGKRIDLSRWEFGYASTFIRAMARGQLRDQLVECNAKPAVFIEQKPRDRMDAFMCCFQSAKRCEVDLDLDRLRDSMLDILITPREDLINMAKQDAEFCMDSERTLSSWKTSPRLFRRIGCEESNIPPSNLMNDGESYDQSVQN